MPPNEARLAAVNVVLLQVTRRGGSRPTSPSCRNSRRRGQRRPNPSPTIDCWCVGGRRCMCSTSSPIKRKIRLKDKTKKRFGLARRAHMPPNPRPFFRCPSCKALYQVVKAEAGPETVVACSICSGPLVAREGQFILKYFLLRKAIPVKGPTALRAKPR